MCFHGNGRFDAELLKNIERPPLGSRALNSGSGEASPAPLLPVCCGTCHDGHPFPVQCPAVCVLKGSASVFPVVSNSLLLILGWDPSSISTATCCPCGKGDPSAVAHRGFSKPACRGEGDGIVCCWVTQGPGFAPAIPVAAAFCSCPVRCAGGNWKAEVSLNTKEPES